MSETFGAAAARSYLEGPPRQVPGFASLHRMTAMLLAERAGSEARILVLGAGGGLELKALAEAQPGWRFDGVDPSAEMIALAAETARPFAAHMALHTGYIADAPAGPFDGAVSLLTFHFIARGERVPTLVQLRERLQPGAPLVLAHISASADPAEREAALGRHATFGGRVPGDIATAVEAMTSRLTILSPEEEEADLRAAGFAGAIPFFTAFAVRGWVAYAGEEPSVVSGSS